MFLLAFLATLFTLFGLSDILDMYGHLASNKLFVILVVLILVGYLIIKFTNRLKNTKEEKEFLFDLINSQENLIIVMKNNDIENANESFFKFFTEYSNIDEFKHEHNDIADLFLKEDGFLHKTKYRNWIGHLSRYNEETYRVKIKKDDEFYIFKIVVRKSEKHEKTIITLSDITEFENSRLLLEEYKRVVDVATIVSKTDLKGKITYVNDAFVKISGYSREELLNKHHNILRSSNVPATIFENMWKTIKSKKVWMGEIENIAKNGMPYFVKATVIPILNVKGEVSEFIALRHDITEEVLSKRKAVHRQERNKEFLEKVAFKIEKPIGNLEEALRCLDEANLNDEQKNCLKNIKSDTETLVDISKEVKEYQK